MSEFELRRRKLFDILPENSVSLLFSGVLKLEAKMIITYSSQIEISSI